MIEFEIITRLALAVPMGGNVRVGKLAAQQSPFLVVSCYPARGGTILCSISEGIGIY